MLIEARLIFSTASVKIGAQTRTRDVQDEIGNADGLHQSAINISTKHSAGKGRSLSS